MSSHALPDIDALNKYLESIDGISYIVAEEGFPVYWSNDLGEEDAEKMIALAVDLKNVLTNTMDIGGEEFYWTSISIAGRNTGIAYLGASLILIVISDKKELVSSVLDNIMRSVRGEKIKCGWCEGDLTLKTIVCPSCGKRLPIGLGTCPLCGARITIVKCPLCGKPVSTMGRKIVYRRRKGDTAAGIVFLAVAIGFAVAGIIKALAGELVSLPLFLASGIIGWMSAQAFSHKVPVEEKP